MASVDSVHNLKKQSSTSEAGFSLRSLKGEAVLFVYKWLLRASVDSVHNLKKQSSTSEAGFSLRSLKGEAGFSLRSLKGEAGLFHLSFEAYKAKKDHPSSVSGTRSTKCENQNNPCSSKPERRRRTFYIFFRKLILKPLT
jgi:hypothetical protein